MTPEMRLVYILLFWNILQLTFFVWQMHKLINKLMSRDFYDYQRGIKYEFPKQDLKLGEVQAIKLDEPDFQPPPNNLGF